MNTQTGQVQTTGNVTVEKAKKPRKSWSTQLVAPDGSATLSIGTRRTPSGFKVDASVISKDAKGKRSYTRGATSEHVSIEEANAAVGKIAAEALRKNWVPKPRTSGYGPKPDAFTLGNIPAAPVAKKK